MNTDPIFLKDDAIQSMLTHAIQIGEQNGIEMDFTENSIREIDKMLSSFHQEFINDPEPDEEGLSGVSLSLGIYIGEILRRSLDADITWYYGIPQVGGEAIAYLFYKGSEVYTIDWVSKQIAGGDKESVWRKYQFFKKKLTK